MRGTIIVIQPFFSLEGVIEIQHLLLQNDLLHC